MDDASPETPPVVTQWGMAFSMFREDILESVEIGRTGVVTRCAVEVAKP